MDSPYARQAPSVQQTLDLFKGKWASRLPAPHQNASAGSAALFEDERVPWAVEALASLGVPIRGAHVLELGPLEGGHTHALSRLGAGSVTAIEAHPEAYLKCLVLKELLGMERVNFLYGDCLEFLRAIRHSYDLAFVSGLLYHMVAPVELLEKVSLRARSVFLWTMCWDAAFCRAHPDANAGSGPAHRAEHAGFVHTLHRHDYGSNLAYGQFWGGPANHAYWMEPEEILGALRHFGYSRIVSTTEPNPYGLALRLVAVKD